MPSLPSILPGLPLSSAERLLVLGALCYVVVGLTYLAYAGITETWSRFNRQEIGDSPAAVLVSAAAWALVVVLWPAPLMCRTVRALCRRSPSGPNEDLIWRSVRPPVVPVVAAQPVAARAELYRVPPRWYRQEYEAIRAVFATGETVVAQARAFGLVETSVSTFGPSHPYTRDAWDLLAHIARTAFTAHHAVADSVYCCPGCPAAATWRAA